RLLLDHGASVEKPENIRGGLTPLQTASYWGTLEVTKILLEYGAVVNERRNQRHQDLPLNLVLKGRAAEKKERVVLLIDHGADVTLRNHSGETVLHILAKHYPDWLEGIALLVGSGADINAEDTVGYRPLHCATDYGHLWTIKAMLEHNANIEDRCRAEDNGTVMHLAVSKRSDGEFAKFFLEKGLSVDAQDNLGNTPLHKAVEWNDWLDIQPKNIEGVKLLLENGASVNLANIAGDTPMHKAVAASFLEAVEALLEYKADINARNYRGETPFHRFYNHRRFEKQNMTLAEVLLQHGADVNATCNHGYTPLHRIIQYYKATVPLINRLLNWGASIETRSSSGITPLHEALRLGGLKTAAEMLLG
ncbi:ankyrin repeat-containing domain protein, partial [Pyronema domesticum]